MRFRHYKNSNSVGNTYAFGLNAYRDPFGLITLDLIVANHVFVLIFGRIK